MSRINTRTSISLVLVLVLLGVASAHSYVEEKKCYKTGEKCAGELGYDKVHYMPCCHDWEYCGASKKHGDWGSVCMPVEKDHHYYSYAGYEKKCYDSGEKCAGTVGYGIVYSMPCCKESDCCAKEHGETYSVCTSYIKPEDYHKDDYYKPPPKHDYYKPPPKHDYYEPPPKYDDYKSPPKHDYYKPPPKYDDYKSPPKHDYYKPPPKYDDYKSPPKHDYYKPPPKYDDYKSPPHYGYKPDKKPVVSPYM